MSKAKKLDWGITRFDIKEHLATNEQQIEALIAAYAENDVPTINRMLHYVICARRGKCPECSGEGTVPADKRAAAIDKDLVAICSTCYGSGAA